MAKIRLFVWYSFCSCSNSPFSFSVIEATVSLWNSTKCLWNTSRRISKSYCFYMTSLQQCFLTFRFPMWYFLNLWHWNMVRFVYLKIKLDAQIWFSSHKQTVIVIYGRVIFSFDLLKGGQWLKTTKKKEIIVIFNLKGQKSTLNNISVLNKFIRSTMRP